MLRYYPVLVTLAILLIIVGTSCSSNGPMEPANSIPILTRDNQSGSHQCWGLYRFVINPDARTLEFEPLREAHMHLNALPFLEPSSPPLLSLETIEFTGNSVIAGIGLRHPFYGLNEFTGFDVCGIVITDGSLFGFVDNEIRLAKPDETRLVNADGYSRWWNPREFPHTTTIFGYKDGLMGLPDEVVEYASTINGYKYFCDDLDANDPLTDVDINNRGVFSAGQKNVRNFEIQWDEFGLIFNYAIDASWEFPTGDYPWTAPDDFGPGANRPEAWNIVVDETDNTLFNDGTFSGGDLSLSIDVYDWYNPELNVLRVESPAHFDSITVNTPTGGGTGYSTYEVEITSIDPPEEWLDILITAECEEIGYQGMLPGRKVSAYQRHFATVSSEGEMLQITSPNGGESWDAWTEHDITWNTTGPVGNVKLEYSKDDFVGDIHLIVADTDNDDTYTWFVPNDPTTTAKVRITEVGDPATFDISDGPFTINQDNTPIWPYYGCDAKSRCLSAFNGTTSTNIKWTYTTEAIWSDSPVIGPDGTIYCGIYKHTGTKNSPGCVAIDPVDGLQEWIHFPGLGNYSGRNPAVSPDGQYVYYGSDTGPSQQYRGIMYCIDASDGSEEWAFQLPNSIASQYELIDGAPKIDANGDLYFHSLRPMGQAKFWGIDSTGNYKWHQSINGYSYSDMQYHSPCIGNDGNIYTVDSGGQCWKFDSDGTSLWSAVYVNYHTKYCGSLDDSNNFYVACDDGRDVNKFAPDGTILWTTPQWDFYLHCGPAHDSQGYIYATGGWDTPTSGYRIRKMDPSDGSTVWEHTLGAITTALMAISADGYIYIGCGNGLSYGPGVQCWDTDGNQVYNLSFSYACRSPIIGADGTIYVISNKKLYAIGS